MLKSEQNLTLSPQARQDAPLSRITIVGNSFGSWIARLMAQEFEQIERLILIAPAFNMMGVRAKSINPERRQAWHRAGWRPRDDDSAYPVELDLIPSDHRLSRPEHVERFHRLVLDNV